MDLELKYQFSPLAHPCNTRPLQLQPASYYNDGLRATMIEVSLSEQSPIYDAVSYTWGDQTPFNTIDFDGSQLVISKNVSELLRHFRSSSETHCLWLDSVCIDQENEAEKGPQVYMMDAVYTRAKAVRIWVGPDEGFAGRAMSCATKLAEEHGSHLKTYASRSKWMPPPCFLEDVEISASTLERIVQLASSEDLVALCTRDWFTRLWIIQEVALAKEPIVYCGSHELPWSTLEQAVRIVIAAARRLGHDFAHSSVLTSVIAIDDIREHYRYASNHELLLGPVADYDLWGDVVVKMSGQKCTIDHDRVYALLGLRPRWLEKFNPAQRRVTEFSDYKVDISAFSRAFTFDMFIGSN